MWCHTLIGLQYYRLQKVNKRAWKVYWNLVMDKRFLNTIRCYLKFRLENFAAYLKIHFLTIYYCEFIFELQGLLHLSCLLDCLTCVQFFRKSSILIISLKPNCFPGALQIWKHSKTWLSSMLQKGILTSLLLLQLELSANDNREPVKKKMDQRGI